MADNKDTGKRTNFGDSAGSKDRPVTGQKTSAQPTNESKGEKKK